MISTKQSVQCQPESVKKLKVHIFSKKTEKNLSAQSFCQEGKKSPEILAITMTTELDQRG